jgi:transcriptional regulator with XRE-family HTH domain
MEKPPLAKKLSARQIFARNLRRYRRMHDISQEKLAIDAEMSRSYLSGVERAERNISIDNMEKLSIALNVSLPALLDETLFDGVEKR